MNARIYDRPDLDQRTAQLALFITGSLAGGKPALAYEGRLQVHNGIGGMTVEQIDGDRLPNGSSLYIEGNEIVLSWPAYTEVQATIPNFGYEDGDTSWVKGAGWSIGTENPITGLRSARYGENAGESPIANTARYPVNPGVAITATCKVRQGASAEGNAGARVKLQWLSAAGAVMSESLGNAVMSASKNRVYPSTVVAQPPAGAELVCIAADGIRYRENKALFIDDFEWDHVQTTGVNVDRVIALTLRVRDSAGRSAIWRGAVVIQLTPADPYWQFVHALFHFDDPDGTTVPSFESGIPGTLPIVNSYDNFAVVHGPSVFPPGAAYFDGGGSYFQLAGGMGGENLGTRPFTVEFRVLAEGPTGVFKPMLSFGSNTFAIIWHEGQLGLYPLAITGDPPVFGPTLAAGIWYAIALSVDETSFYLFCDGVLVLTGPRGSFFNSESTTWYVGQGIARRWSGRIDELRITVGVCRYTESYIPATEPFPAFGP
ncbi:LamG-like jellyroll fold domain-containing protein [Stenotrophomonas pavanii]|uniref:LamG-like jellyroll fold domain-containing protein n=1 Tax=Stenotrophomonas pavanii TaxID=487698 RepID=UPI0028B107B9|nr:LamG-like jellyroll fold domain-containing protein [Stenotrophomonas pavanii]